VRRFGAQLGGHRPERCVVLVALMASSPSADKKGPAAFAGGANEREWLGEGRLALISSGRFNLVLRVRHHPLGLADKFRLLDHGDLVSHDSGIVVPLRQYRIQSHR
jgi:hypothetical protein